VEEGRIVSEPRNTSKIHPFEHLLGALAEGTDGYITGMEKQGQQEVVNSDVLPNPDQSDFGNPIGRAPFEAMGIVWGDPVEGDPLFVHVTLPQGWKKVGSDHDMWSYVQDVRGEDRIGVFYKAAFYDRRAAVTVIEMCDCKHSRNAHPWAGVLVEGSPENRWKPTYAPQVCTRPDCGCPEFKAFRRIDPTRRWRSRRG
jgi:hypothetical protein